MNSTEFPPDTIKRAAETIAASQSILITAGAGMGVDSGLPDFRGPEGFWKAYPPMKELGLSFSQMSTPRWFHEDPALAWGFFGHRLALYRAAVPHRGYEILRKWTAAKQHFVFTSNVDGQFLRAGFSEDAICEVHGSIHHLQCLENPRGTGIWPTGDTVIAIDEKTMRASDPLPKCPRCGGLARPNILMFGDGDWLEHRTETQADRMSDWLVAAAAPIVVIEMGAGNGVPTVRDFSERVMKSMKAGLIRINPREADGPEGTISIESGAADALQRIAAAIRA